MQKAEFCYRENANKERMAKKDELGLRPNIRNSSGVVLHQFLPESDGIFPTGALRRRASAPINCGFEAR